jgi:small subunit ribosomal protein S2
LTKKTLFNRNVFKEIEFLSTKMAETDSFLVAQDTYLRAGIHIGTKFRTKYMAPFIYKTRPDGLSVLNIQKIDERIRIAVNFLSKFKPEEILIVSRRENGWKAAKMCAKAIGAKAQAGRYPPGLLTNTNLENFMEVKVIIITDSWPDRNALIDAGKIGVPVVGLCDTNNQPNNIDLVVPCNNKGKKSLGLFFYILAREYLKNNGKLDKEKEKELVLEDYLDEE